MSKYDKLWEYVEEQEGDELVLTFDEIGAIAGVPLDHSFLNYKKELLPQGWEVGKISMKQHTVRFQRLAEKGCQNRGSRETKRSRRSGAGRLRRRWGKARLRRREMIREPTRLRRSYLRHGPRKSTKASRSRCRSTGRKSSCCKGPQRKGPG